MTKKMKSRSFVIMNNLLIILSVTECAFSNVLDLEFQTEPITVMVTPQDGRVIFRCVASPSSAVISWLWNGEHLVTNTDNRFHVGQHKLVVSLPKNNKEAIKSFDGSEVRCKARYRKKTLISLPSKLIIGRLDPFPEHDDVHIIASTGNIVVIPCKPPPSVPIAVTEFEFNGTIISRSTAHYRLMPSGNLQIFGAHYNDSGSYRCNVINPFLNERRFGQHKTILSVKDVQQQHQPEFLSTPDSITNVVMGSNVTLECAVSGFPFPNVTWYKENGRLPKGRHIQIGGNLLLYNIMQEDKGQYTCHADNGVGEAISASTLLSFQEVPQLSGSLNDHQVMKGGNITVGCAAKGYPKPEITWYHNGKRLITTNRIHVKDGTITIKKILAKDSGIYQCFASNELGAVYGVFVIDVTDSSDVLLELDHEEGNQTLNEGHNIYEDPLGENKNHKKKKHKGVKMVPPSKPEVTRLSDNSAMVRWDVPQNDGLPILFFRVQYKEVGRKGGQWKTIDEDIASHLHAHAVTGLKTGGRYRFRIAAVYANHDNKLGPSSAKFILHKDPPSKRPEAGPTIVSAEAVSPSAITLHWEYYDVDTVPIEGFFIYYRETHSAGEYLQVTVLGANTRSHILSHLLPDNSYDIKMQCFNLYGTSDFSNIYTCKTFEPIHSHGYNDKPQEDRPSPNSGSSIEIHSKSEGNSKLIYIILASVLGIMVLILTVFIILCVRKQQQRHRQPLPSTPVALELQVKPDMNGHVSTGNGYIKRKDKINISVNPLGEYLKEEATKLNRRSLDIPCHKNEETVLCSLEREDKQQYSEKDTYTDDNTPQSLENISESNPMLPLNGESNEGESVAPG